MRLRLVSVVLLLSLMALGGCHGRGGNAVVTQYPRWEYQKYSRLAVVPGHATRPEAAGDAAVLSDRLTTLLTQNGTFTVLSRAELKDVFAEQDLARLAEAEEGTLLPENKITIAQALVVPSITDYKLIAKREQQSRPVFAYDRYGRRIPIGEEIVEMFVHGAEVEGSVRVIDAATGKILLSHTVRRAAAPRSSLGGPPQVSPQQMASGVARSLAEEFAKLIAPTEVRVKLKSDMLVVATAYFDGAYQTPKRLPLDCTEFLVAVCELPGQTLGNTFRVAISAREGLENLWEEEFVWSDPGPEGVTFKVPVTVLEKAPTADFEAKLYSGRNPEPILRRKFAVERPKETVRTEMRRTEVRSTTRPAQNGE
jgi:hypothetical protein